MASLLLLLLLSTVTRSLAASSDPPRRATQPLLFLDDGVLDADGLRGGARLELQVPQKLGRLLTPEYEWEMWELGGYDTWLQLPNRTMYFYYTCIANCSGTSDAGCIQRVCLAASEDGINFRKPFVHQIVYKGSKANNIVWPPAGSETSYGGSAFLDKNPAAPPSERFKMLLTGGLWGGKDPDSHPAGEYALSSPDGIAWKPMSDMPAHLGSDSQQTGWWDATLGKYVIYVRNDGYDMKDNDGPRYIGRCVTSNLSNWYEDAPPAKTGCVPTEVALAIKVNLPPPCIYSLAILDIKYTGWWQSDCNIGAHAEAAPCQKCESVFGPDDVDPTQLYTSGATSPGR
jgi:hypothetical protein